MKVKIIKEQWHKGIPLWFNDYISQEFEVEQEDYWHKDYIVIEGIFKDRLIPNYCCERS
jgi:hypothetical protein